MPLTQVGLLLGLVAVALSGVAAWAWLRAERRLRQRTQELDRFFTTTLDLLCIADIDGRFRRLNPQWEAVLGYPSGTLEGTSFMDLVHPEDRESTLLAIARLGEQEQVVGLENRFRCRDGSYRWLEWRSSPRGRLIYAAARDVTKRKLAESSLAKEQSFTKAVLDSVPGLLYVYDDQGRLVRWNKQHETMTGYSADELAQMTLFDWYRGYPEEEARIARAVARIPVDGHAEEEALLVTKSGERIPFYFTAVGQQVDGRDYFVGIGIDVTERRRAEAALRENEARLRLALAGTQQGLYDLDLRTGDAIVSPEYLGALGYGPDDGVTVNAAWWQAQIHPDDGPGVGELLDRCVQGQQHEYRTEYRLRHKDGSWRWMLSLGRVVEVDQQGRGVRLLGTHTDITERRLAEIQRRQLEERLAQSQKMESVGRLAGGVAHDFNNMIQSILGNTALALEESPADAACRQSLEEIKDSAQRSADLTRQLLGFARKQAIEPRVVDLNETVAGMLKMLGRLIGEGVQLSWLPGRDLWRIRVDSSQVDQVLANLCVNARDAMDGIGRLTIETHNVSIDEGAASLYPDGAAGDYVLLVVSDTGRGMDAATKAHLFEPFYTTKSVGQGTGLGLATVFGIVKQNGGLIGVYSELGHGTCFKLYFPRTSVVEAPQAVLPVSAVVDGNETVLLVEDEARVLRLCQRLLRKHGYNVLAATCPEEARTLAASYEGTIHLLLTDVVMPGGTGKQLWEELRAVRPEIRCLFMSGYTSDVIAREGVLDAGVNFIQKPFMLDVLVRKVRASIDAR